LVDVAFRRLWGSRWLRISRWTSVGRSVVVVVVSCQTPITSYCGENLFWLVLSEAVTMRKGNVRVGRDENEDLLWLWRLRSVVAYYVELEISYELSSIEESAINRYPPVDASANTEYLIPLNAASSPASVLSVARS
jgi:hypothetical protein